MCETEISHMGKNNGNPDLVCENICNLHSAERGFLCLAAVQVETARVS